MKIMKCCVQKARKFQKNPGFSYWEAYTMRCASRARGGAPDPESVKIFELVEKTLQIKISQKNLVFQLLGNPEQ